MTRSYRQERLNERIKELIGEFVQTRVKDPRIGLVTITGVSIAPDYTTAKVYFTVMGDETARAATREGLESARSFLRKALGRELKLRQTPELRFLYDDTLDRAMRIDEVIRGTRGGQSEESPREELERGESESGGAPEGEGEISE